MSRVNEIEQEWDRGVEDDTLDPGGVFAKLLRYAYKLENKIEKLK